MCHIFESNGTSVNKHPSEHLRHVIQFPTPSPLSRILVLLGVASFQEAVPWKAIRVVDYMREEEKMDHCCKEKPSSGRLNPMIELVLYMSQRSREFHSIMKTKTA